jgi:hypothetical protein
MFKDEKSFKEFEKLTKVSIPVSTHFQYYIDLVSKTSGNEKIKDLVVEFYEFEQRVGDVSSYKKQSLEKIVSYVKDSEAYERFTNETEYIARMEIPTFDKVNEFAKTGRKMLSIDISSANFNVLKLYDSKNEFGDSWEALLDILEIDKFLSKSKSFRQAVLGHLNPKRQQKVLLYHMNNLYSVIPDDSVTKDKVLRLSNDEIVFIYESFLHTDVRKIIDKIAFHLPLNHTVFSLEKIENVKGGYVKTIFDMDLNSRNVTSFGCGGYDKYISTKKLFGVPGNIYYPMLKKHVLNEEIDEKDLYFINDGRLAMWDRNSF